MNDEPQIILGERHGWGEPQRFGISREDQRQHIYIIGKTGSGKTTLLRNMIVQHIALGHGVGLIDPHGDLAEEILNHIPPHRADHLVYFNPGDIEYPIAFNLLANVAPDDRHLVASGIVSAFKGIWRDSWGPRLEYIFCDESKDFFAQPDRIKRHLASANQHLIDKKHQVEGHARQLEKVRAEMRKTYQLYQADHITPDGFGRVYKPLEEQERALTAELPRLQGEVDALEVRQVSADEVVAEATNLHKIWPAMNMDEKRRIVESIVEKIVLTRDQIDITFAYMPSCEELTKRQRNL